MSPSKESNNAPEARSYLYPYQNMDKYGNTPRHVHVAGLLIIVTVSKHTDNDGKNPTK
jgi:hypothetical protein